MTRDDLEQAIYARTRRFVDSDVQEAIIDLIAAEREACARIVEEPHWKPAVRHVLAERAAAIRARGEK